MNSSLIDHYLSDPVVPSSLHTRRPAEAAKGTKTKALFKYHLPKCPHVHLISPNAAKSVLRTKSRSGGWDASHRRTRHLNYESDVKQGRPVY